MTLDELIDMVSFCVERCDEGLSVSKLEDSKTILKALKLLKEQTPVKPETIVITNSAVDYADCQRKQRSKMSDVEKVIQGFRHCLCEDETEGDGNGCKGCPYENVTYCADRLRRDAIAVLEGRETKWFHREDMDYKDKYGINHYHGMCTTCGFVHDFIDGHTEQYLYCPQCGGAVKWYDRVHL